ncbi:MAG: heme-binding protein [Saprospiraceae bacterium]
MKSIFLSLLAGLLFVLPAKAQVAPSYELTLEGAQQILTQAITWAQTNKVPSGAIAITDAGGNLLLLVRLDHTFPKAAEVAHGKARTAALFQFASQKLEDAVNGGRVTLPIQYNGKVIGAIGVSGTASADQDVQLAQAGLEAAFLKM